MSKKPKQEILSIRDDLSKSFNEIKSEAKINRYTKGEYICLMWETLKKHGIKIK
jgi:hypothetical protein